jgi:hypothetical protein
MLKLTIGVNTVSVCVHDREQPSHQCNNVASATINFYGNTTRTTCNTVLLMRANI